MKETEKLLDTWKHPDPYAPPTAPGGTFSSLQQRAVAGFVDIDQVLTPGCPGSKYERNLPAPILDRELPTAPYSHGAAEADLGCSSSTIKILDIKWAWVGAEGHGVHSGAVANGNQWETKQLQLRRSCCTSLLVTSVVLLGHFWSQMTLFVNARPTQSRRSRESRPKSNSHFGAEGGVPMYNPKDSERRRPLSGRARHATRRSLHTRQGIPQTRVFMASYTGSSSAQAIAKTLPPSRGLANTITVTNAMESRKPSVCCS